MTEQDKLDNFMSSLVFQKENGVLFGGREPAMREDGATWPLHCMPLRQVVIALVGGLISTAWCGQDETTAGY